VRLAAVSAAVAIVLLDVTAVGVLLPTIRVDLGSSAAGGQWVMNAYLLALAAVLPLAARIRVDGRLLAAAGALALACGAVLSAKAGTTGALVGGRAVAGTGAALLLTSLATPLPRGRALAAAAALPAAALALGPLVGGELGEHNWWRLFFWTGVPAAAVLAAPALLGGPRKASAPRSSGHALPKAAGLVALTILLVQSEPWGVGSPGLVQALGAFAAIMLLGRVDSERTIWIAAAGALTALCFLLPQYFELAHLIHPLRSGIRLSVLTVAALAGGVAAWQLRSILPGRWVALAGVIVGGAGLIALSALGPHSGSALLGAGLLLAGGGFGVAAGAAYDGRLGELLAAAVPGAALSLAFAGALFQHVQADERSGGASFEEALSRGLDRSVLLLLALVGASAANLLLAQRRARPASSAARPAVES
jgi:MFS family permease